MIDVKFEFNKEDLKYLKRMPKLFMTGLYKGLRRASMYAEAEAKKGFDKGTGPPNPPPGPLKTRTGHLRRSIKSGVIKNTLTGWIGTEVFYGKVHEDIGAGKAKVLRPFLQPAVENNINKINDLIRESILKEFP